MRALGFVLLVLLGGCATTEWERGEKIVYPDDLASYAAAPPERWAEPGDIVWLSVLHQPRWVLSDATLDGRDPATGQPVSRRVDRWPSIATAGRARFFAPRFDPDIPTPPDDRTPPYACIVGDDYARANLTWSLSRCRPGPRREGVQLSRTSDPRDWTEITLRLRDVADGKARFVARTRQGGARRTFGPPEDSRRPLPEDIAFSGAVGYVRLPETVYGVDVEFTITRIEGQRVFYRLQRRAYPCKNPLGCVEE